MTVATAFVASILALTTLDARAAVAVAVVLIQMAVAWVAR